MVEIIYKVIFICVFASTAILIIKNISPSYIPVIAISAGVICFCIVAPYIKLGLETVDNLAKKTDTLAQCAKITFKVVGISVLCEFASQICADSGENYLASKIDFVGKVVIICITSPLLTSLINKVTDMISVL